MCVSVDREKEMTYPPVFWLSSPRSISAKILDIGERSRKDSRECAVTMLIHPAKSTGTQAEMNGRAMA